MMLAYELKVPISVIEEMHPDEYTQWLAFFKLTAELRKQKTGK